jgi:hypothetical protein
MTTDTHPDELELFEYVEGDLDEGRVGAVAAHVASCPRCAEELRLLEAGKAALRDSALLQLPELRRKRVLAELPRQRERRPVFSSRRLVAVLAPVAAVVAIAIAITNADFGSNGDAEQAAAPAVALEANDAAREDSASGAAAAEPGAAAPGEAADAAEALEAAPAPVVAEVEGPPAEVARFLREAGFDARVRAGEVEVVGADPKAVELALLDYAHGDVRVVVR